MRTSLPIAALLGIGLAAFATSALAQSYAYPAKGQSPEQQASDEAQCHAWAQQQTGGAPPPPPPGTKVRGTVRGGACGAAGGAAIGAIAGDAGKGAAVGAVVGGVRGRRQTKQAVAAQQAGAADATQRAFGACMQGRGYSVKGTTGHPLVPLRHSSSRA